MSINPKYDSTVRGALEFTRDMAEVVAHSELGDVVSAGVKACEVAEKIFNGTAEFWEGGNGGIQAPK